MNSALRGSIREAEMLELSLQKDDAGVERQGGELHRRMDVLGGRACSGGWLNKPRLQDELHSGHAQLEQWVSEKAGQEAGLLEIRERVEAIERESMAIQQRLTEVRLSLESIRGRRDHGTE